MERDAKKPKLSLSKDDGEAQKELTDTIGELEERLTEIDSFDQAEMINFQCDDLIIEVSLTVQSQIEHLNKLEAGLLEQIEKHRAERLQDLSSGVNGKRLADMKQEINAILSRIQELKSQESSSLETSMQKALEEASNLSLRASLFMARIKRDALNQAMRFEKNQEFLNSNNLVGKIEKANFAVDSYKLSKFKSYQSKSYRTSNSRSVCASVRTIAFIRDDMLAYSTIFRSIIAFWNPIDERFLFELKGHTNEITCLVHLSNCSLASCSRDNTIKIWNVDTRTLVRTLKGNTNSIFSLVVLPNGNLASLADHRDHSIKIWNPHNNENNLINSIEFDSSFIQIGALSNGFLVGFTMKKLVVFNPHSGRIVKSIASQADKPDILSLLVLKDDRVAVTFSSDGGMIEIFDLLNLEIKSVITKPQQKEDLKVFAQLPNGLIASSSNNRGESKIILRDSQGGTEVSTIQTNTYTYHTAMSVSKDGRFLAVGDIAGTIQTWPLTD